jgi:hypothetical protein
MLALGEGSSRCVEGLTSTRFVVAAVIMRSDNQPLVEFKSAGGLELQVPENKGLIKGRP